MRSFAEQDLDSQIHPRADQEADAVRFRVMSRRVFVQ